MTETIIAVVGMTRLATDETQTVNHAAGTEDTRSGTHGEVTTMTMDSTTMTDEGGTMEVIDVEGEMATRVMMMVDLGGEGTRAVETTDTQADTTRAMIEA